LQFDSEVLRHAKLKEASLSGRLLRMVYLKSTLVGIVIFFIATVGYIIGAAYLAIRNITPPPGAEVSFVVGSIFSRSSYWLAAIAAFALGFYWEFRRAM